MTLIFFVLSLVLCALATFGVGGKYNLLAAGVFFFVLTFAWALLPKG